MRDFYGTVGFSCVLMGLISLVVLATGAQAAPTPVVEQRADRLAGWSEDARLIASRITAKYGPPDEVRPDALEWRARAPWKRIVVRRDAPQRDFPVAHGDHLEQTVVYRKTGGADPTLFDEGVVADAEKAELTSRSDREEYNLLALNLADEVIRGKRSPESARDQARQTVQMLSAGRTTAYTGGLLFRVD